MAFLFWAQKVKWKIFIFLFLFLWFKSCLDLANNKIDDAEIVQVLLDLPELACLYLNGNPVVRNIPQYRKTLIARIPTLTYLDDRPVFEKERLAAEAWFNGGKEAEQEERERQRLKTEEESHKEYLAFRNLMKLDKNTDNNNEKSSNGNLDENGEEMTPEIEKVEEIEEEEEEEHIPVRKAFHLEI